MEIIIGFSRAKSFWKIGSKIIAEAEKRNYSHAYIKITDPTTEVNLVYQASLGMVNLYNYDLFKEDNIVVEEYIISDVPEDKAKELLTFLQKNLGKPYSKKMILLLSIKKLLGFEIKYTDNDTQFVCSELAARVIEIVEGIKLDINVDYVTPSDLNKLINKLNIPRL